jgi:hypothetical protein
VSERKALKGLEDLGTTLGCDPEKMFGLAEKALRVRDREGRLQPLIANAAQRRYEERRGRQNIVLKARQMGITTWVAARFFLRTITRPGTMTLQVAHTQAAAESIFRVVQRMWEELPEDLRAGPLVRSRANVGQMVFPKLDSEFRVGSASDGSVGRGLSLQNLHCSEVSRWPRDAAETLAGLRAALAPDGELVLESTPNGAYGAFYDEWLAGSDTAGAGDALVRHFLPWWMEPAYVGSAVGGLEMTEEECALVVRHGLSAEQIGFRRGLERSYGVLRSQEFVEDAETCFRATGSSCFDVDAIERQLAEVPGVLETRLGGALLVWLNALSGREYLVAVDSAGGGSEGDFAAVQVIEVSTGLQCAELQQKLRPSELAKAAVALAKEYGGATIAVERNNHGAAVLAYLETNEKYRKIWRDGREAGWLMLEQTPEAFVSRRLLGECRTFVSGERGRSGAANGSHDDLVMAMAVAQSVRAAMLETGIR